MATKSSIRKWVRRHTNKHKCACGCGNFIEVRPEHHKRGVPKFIKGHNFSSGYNPRVEGPGSLDVKSSTWEMLSEEEKQRRLNNLNMFGSRENHPGWKGGRVYDEFGYVHIRMPEHPCARDGYVLEHRLVMEEYLADKYPHSPYLMKSEGRICLRPEVVVHHIDEVKDNNELENLYPFPNAAAHAFWHNSPLSEKEKLEIIKSGKYKIR